MTKTVILLRHAKSSWNAPGLGDFERSLNKRGTKAAAQVGAYMKEQGLIPDLVLCSAARRAEQTWQLVAEALGPDIPVKQHRSLYLAAPSRMLTALRRLPETVDRVLMVAHNPGTERLAECLSGQGSEPAPLGRLRQHYPTGGLAEIAFELSAWPALDQGTGRLIRFVVPREL